MRALVAALFVATILITGGAPARACDPYWDWWCDWSSWYDPYWGLPAYEEPYTWSEPESVHHAPPYEPESFIHVPAYEPEPVFDVGPVFHAPIYEPVPVANSSPGPSWTDPVVWTAPSTDVLQAWVEPAAPPAPIALIDPIALAPAGTHQVTEVWTGHSAISEGPVTTYTSTSATVDAGTRARLVTTVGTGEMTAYDGMLLGGRMTLSDGRVVAGDIYENYVWNGYEWVRSAYVFFQDDLEIARLARETDSLPAPASTAAPIMAAAAPTVVGTPAPAPSHAYAVPVVDTTTAIAEPVPPLGPYPPAPAAASVVRVGIALAPLADPLERIEVLRGRRVPLWPRATVDGVPATVVRWQLLSGEMTTLGPTSGSDGEPLVAMWPSVGRPGATYRAALQVTVDVPGSAPRDLEASIDVVVRSPAIIE